MNPGDRIRIRYLQDVRVPEQSAGKAGETRELPWLNARHLLEDGYAERVNGSVTPIEEENDGSSD